MTQECWMTWVLLLGLLCISPVYGGKKSEWSKCSDIFVVAGTFNCFVAEQNSKQRIVYLEKNATVTRKLHRSWPQMATHGSTCAFNHSVKEPCQVRCLQTKTICKTTDYDQNFCKIMDSKVDDKFIINVTETDENCYNCDNPVKKPQTEIHVKPPDKTVDGKIDPRAALQVVENFAKLAATCDKSSASFSGGEGIEGIMAKETSPTDLEEVSFAYMTPNDSMSIVSNSHLPTFSRSVTVPKEAFDKALASNVSEPYVTLIRFLNMAQDAMNSTVLGNEILAVEMGAPIMNLTDKININFRNMAFEGTPSCHSWDGEGSRPNWTSDGCRTVENRPNITCECTHLTFFAILMSPPNDTISSSDLNNLTIITQVGCGLSIFFLGIILFMHFLLRRTKATDTARILVHLVSAMLLLNLTFLTNNFVAEMQSPVACKLMAGLMHYFMLATFSWFAAQGFHLCLHMYKGPSMPPPHYMVKVSVTCWVIPSVVVAALYAAGKYGGLVIHTDNPADNVAMCWITDGSVQYIVNIGYYALVFLFTFATFIVILSWLYGLRKTQANPAQGNKSSINSVTVLGLCCMLGITWGFAFFAYGVLRIPSYYIFTVLNSFQGFFLFIYYYCNSKPIETIVGQSSSTSQSGTSGATTIGVNLLHLENPYDNQPEKIKL